MLKKKIGLMQIVTRTNILVAICAVIPFIMIVWLQTAPFSGIDIWWHLRVGQDILRDGIWPWPDRYTYTVSGTDSTSHQWLSGCLLWLIHCAGGESGLWFFRVLVHLMTLAVFALIIRVRNTPPALSILLLLLFAHCLSYRLIRPQILSPLLFTLIVLGFEKWKLSGLTAPKFISVLLCIALWGNLHGGFVFGVLTATVYLLFAKTRINSEQGQASTDAPMVPLSLEFKLIGILLIWLAATMNPEGPLGLINGGKHLGSPTVDWKPPIPFTRTFGMTPFIWCALFSLIILVIMRIPGLFRSSSNRNARSDIYLSILFCALSLLAVRFNWLIPFGLLFAQSEGRNLSQGYLKSAVQLLQSKKALSIGLVVGSIILASNRFEYTPPSKSIEKSVQTIRLMGINGNTFSLFTQGGYLMWQMPNSKIFMDTRVELYEDKIMESYFKILRWDMNSTGLLGAYGTQLVILPHLDCKPFILTNDGRFTRILATPTSSVYLNTGKSMQGQWDAVTSYYARHGLHVDRENGFSLQNALVAAPSFLSETLGFDPSDIEHWTQLLTVASSPSDSQEFQDAMHKASLSPQSDSPEDQSALAEKALLILTYEWMKKTLYYDVRSLLRERAHPRSSNAYYAMLSEACRLTGDDANARFYAAAVAGREAASQ